MESPLRDELWSTGGIVIWWENISTVWESVVNIKDTEDIFRLSKSKVSDICFFFAANNDKLSI